MILLPVVVLLAEIGEGDPYHFDANLLTHSSLLNPFRIWLRMLCIIRSIGSPQWKAQHARSGHDADILRFCCAREPPSHRAHGVSFMEVPPQIYAVGNQDSLDPLSNFEDSSGVG